MLTKKKILTKKKNGKLRPALILIASCICCLAQIILQRPSAALTRLTPKICLSPAANLLPILGGRFQCNNSRDFFLWSKRRSSPQPQCLAPQSFGFNLYAKESIYFTLSFHLVLLIYINLLLPAHFPPMAHA